MSSSNLLSSANEEVRGFSQFLIKNHLVHTVSGFVNYNISDIEKNLQEIIDFIDFSSDKDSVELLLNTNPNLIAYGNEPKIEIEERQSTKLKLFFKYPIKKIPNTIKTKSYAMHRNHLRGVRCPLVFVVLLLIR